MEEQKGKPRSLRLLFKHADTLDKVLMALGTIGCVVDGSTVAADMLVLSSLMNTYGRGSSGITLDDVDKVINHTSVTNLTQKHELITWLHLKNMCLQL